MADGRERIVQRRPALTLLAAVSGAILWDRWLGWPLTVWLPTSSIALVLWVVTRRDADRAGKWILLSVCCLGGAWHHVRWNLFSRHDVGLRATARGTPMILEGVVRSRTRWSPAPPADPLCTVQMSDRTRFDVVVDRLQEDHDWQPAAGLVSVHVDGRLTLPVGARIRLAGHLVSPPPSLNWGQPSARAFYRGDRQLARLSVSDVAAVHVLAATRWRSGQRWLQRVRERFAATFHRHVGSEYGRLANAIVLGLREQVPKATSDSFWRTGTIHLLSISGLHLGIMVSGIWVLSYLGWVNRHASLLLAIVFSLFYAVLTEGRPPIVRATTLITSFCLARFFVRNSPPLNALGTAGLVVLVINPHELFMAGTQLSFLAVGTLVHCGSWFKAPREQVGLRALIARSRSRWLRMVLGAARTLGRIWLASAWVWLVTSPLVLARFNLLSPASLLLNLILWLPMTIVLYSAVLCVLTSWLIPPLASIAGWVCRSQLAWIEHSVQWADTFSWGHWWLPGPARWWLFLFYGVLLLAVWRQRPALGTMRRWLTLGLLGLVSWGPVTRQWMPRKGVQCTFIAVGHGTSVLVETPHAVLLYDAGRLGPPEGAVRAISAVLWSRGITRIDRVVLSHADADHYNALPGLTERFRIDEVCVSPYMFEDDSAALTALRESLQSHGVPVSMIADGATWGDAASTFRVLHPPAIGDKGSDNGRSLVVTVEPNDGAGERLLLTGDLEGGGLRRLLARRAGTFDVILAPHHGSPRSDPVGMARWAQARWSIISCGPGFDVAESESIYRRHGTRTLTTWRVGAVRVKLGSGRLKLLSRCLEPLD